MSRYIDADKLKESIPETRIDIFENCRNCKMLEDEEVIELIDEQPTADVVEVGNWCDMHEYIIEMQADENGHNEFFRIIKLPVILSYER